MSAAKCTRKLRGARGRQCGVVLEITTDGAGVVIDVCPKCSRTERGICRDCPNRVDGRALWCSSCKARRRLEAERRWMSDPENRSRKNARHREYSKRPDRRERKRELRRAWYAEHPEAKRKHRRRYHLKRTPGYVAGYQRWNADPARQQKKRDQALARYYALHPTRPDAKCIDCGRDTGWRPKKGGKSGAPPKRCFGCAPMPEVMRRIRRGFALWEAKMARRRLRLERKSRQTKAAA